METALKTWHASSWTILFISSVCQFWLQTTIIPVSGDILFEARETQLCSYEMSETGSIGDASCFLENLSFTVGVQVDVEDRLLFFSDINEGTLRRVDIADGMQEVEQIFHGLGSVEDIAVDWVANNLYWTDYQLGHICVSRYDGSHRAILIPEQHGPRSIAINPRNAQLFWTNIGDTLTAGSIMRADLAGNNVRVIVESGLSSPNGLAIDFSGSRLYFADRGTEKIASVRFNGNDRVELYEAPNADFFDMTILEGFLYTTRWSGSDPNGYITAVEYPEGDQTDFVPTVIEIEQHSGKALGITTFDESRQPLHGPNNQGQCGDYNGGCDHLCLPLTNSNHECGCATGFTLADDGVSCKTDITDKDFLLFIDSSLSTIFQGHLNTSGMTILSAVDLDEVQYPVDLAYDPVEAKVYWTDRSTKSVSRSRLDGSEYQIVAARNVEDPSGIDLDVLRRQVYWVDEDTKTINVINMDLTGQKVVIEGGLDEPRALTVNPLTGEIFWSDWGQRAKIEKANLDGSNRQTIVSSDVGWPNGIAIDVSAGKIFWCDAQYDLIETCDLDGNNRRVAAYLDDTAHPFGLAIEGRYIYWSDWTTRAVYSIDRSNGDNIKITENEDVFLRLQGMTLGTVSYPLNATLSTAAPEPTTTRSPVPSDNDSLTSDNLVIIIAAAVGGGLGFLAIIIIATLVVCKCSKKRPSSLEAHRATENHAMKDLPPPYETYPGKNIATVNVPPALPSQSKLRPEESLKRNSRGDHIYEDLDGYRSGLSFDSDAYLNPAFVKEQSEYTGLKTNRPSAAIRDTYETPSPTLSPKYQSEQSAYYLDLNRQSRTDSMGSYTDLRSNSQSAPKPPSSPRPSQIHNWPPANVVIDQSRSPRISATRPPPSPRFSATGPPPSQRMSATQPPPMHRPSSSESNYMASLGPAPAAPGLYEVSMSMR
ncbi:low-density lipoprotein receptor-related protein 6-like [Amphiura filiformis]|uniref:low-density lipoprotein receptor-related protein 6-like n=1 Tax=Amphiura filiformis TaxID=82378 RepID=UPI003B21D6F7